MRRHDANAAIVLHEFERRFNARLVGFALEVDFVTHVAGFRVHFGGYRHLVERDFHADDLADGSQIAEERQRIHAVAQHIATEMQRNVPVVAAHHAAADRSDLDLRFGVRPGGGHSPWPMPLPAWCRRFRTRQLLQQPDVVVVNLPCAVLSPTPASRSIFAARDPCIATATTPGPASPAVRRNAPGRAHPSSTWVKPTMFSRLEQNRPNLMVWAARNIAFTASVKSSPCSESICSRRSPPCPAAIRVPRHKRLRYLIHVHDFSRRGDQPALPGITTGRRNSWPYCTNP